MHGHKFPGFGAEFFHLKALKQNVSMDMRELRSKPEGTQDFTLSFCPCNLASSLKSTFRFPQLRVQSFIHIAPLGQEMNLNQNVRDCWIH